MAELHSKIEVGSNGHEEAITALESSTKSQI